MIESSSVSADWDTYWRGSSDGASFSSDGVDHPRVRQFWVDTFRALAGGEKLRLVDVASGVGAVVEIARDVLGDDGFAATCVDTSSAAMESLAARMPDVETVVGDAADMPFPDDAFDLALPEEENRSMNGYILDELVNVPLAVETLEVDGARVEVLEATETQVLRARVKLIPSDDRDG